MDRRWRDFDYWRYRLGNPTERFVRTGAAALALLLVVFGGFLAADWLTSAGASDNVTGYTIESTVSKLVTIRDHGKTIVKRVPVIRRVLVPPDTQYVTTTTPGGVRVVKQRVVDYVPVVKRRVYTVKGKTRTVTESRLVPTVRTQTQTQTQIQVQTQTNVVTDQQTVVNTNTVTVVSTRTDTVIQPVTVVETDTRTVTETQTVTTPAETVTVTIPDPGGG